MVLRSFAQQSITDTGWISSGELSDKLTLILGGGARIDELVRLTEFRTSDSTFRVEACWLIIYSYPEEGSDA